MNILYSQFKAFNETTEKTSQSMSISSKLLLVISTTFVLFTSFFIALFLMSISMVLLPFAGLRLWLFKRKLQKYGYNNKRYSDFANNSQPDNSIIDAEFTVVDRDSDKTK